MNLVLFLLQLFLAVGECKELPSDSIFQLDTKWINQDGKSMALSDFREHPIIFSMVYLSCKYTCPTVVSEIQNLVSKLTLKEKNKIRVVLVSFDPKHDTPDEMRKFLIKRNLDPKIWNFLTHSDEKKIRELAAAINFKYKKDNTGEFTHSFVVAVYDTEGVLRAKLNGVNQSKDALIKEIQKIAE